MNKEITKRVILEADYIIDKKETIREIAKVFGVSKSTVHKDLHERLKELDIIKFNIVDKILTHHKMIRHLRGGESTKNKYAKLNKYML